MGFTVRPARLEDVAAMAHAHAQAFYRKHGFEAGGTVQVDDGVREIRMVRRR